MISELTGQLKKWIGAKIEAASHAFSLKFPAVPEGKTVLVAADGNVLDMGKRYRKTSGHAPLFSLFTFFGSS